MTSNARSSEPPREPHSPAVSVVIPTHNGARWIAETMDSVLQQTGVDFEVVVGDHASVDDTLEIVDRYSGDPRLRVVHLPAGGGAVAAWNAVTREARGEYVKLLCHDDVLQPGVLARQVALLDSHPDATMTACRRDIVGPDGGVILEGWGLRGFAEPIDGRRAIIRSVRQGVNSFGEPGCVTIRRDVLTRVGDWDGRRPYVLDLATYHRLFRHGSFVPDLETGATFRLSHDQLSFALRRRQSREVAALYHESLAGLPWHDRLLSLALGTAAAKVAALARRLVYVRLRPESADA